METVTVKPLNASRLRAGSIRWPLYMMILPAFILTIVFSYIPMGGLIIAFQDFRPARGFTGSDWVGTKHFLAMFSTTESIHAFWNTLIIASLKMIFQLIVPIVFALLLNEIRNMPLKRTVQTLVYLPHFL
ncbi:MAG: sugar ABC transporter permease, partial [Gorillibacterium sp.]|nr:sugar ABC transporter permease [Gorillibacterium sp.]